MSLYRTDHLGSRFRPYVEGRKGIAMTDRTAVADARKWSDRTHVDGEAAATLKLKQGWHLWMEREDGTSARPSLITPNSIEGWH